MKPLRKRVLFVTPPGYGHAFPLIPLAWAVRCGGHEVLVATCGVSVSVCARAGLKVVNVAPKVHFAAIYARHRGSFADSVGGANGRDPIPQEHSIFAEICHAMAGGLYEVAGEWNADLIVFTPDAAAAPVIATALDIPSVFLGVGLFYTMEVMAESLYSALGNECERWRVSELESPVASIDVAPPSISRSNPAAWKMRWIQYNGGDSGTPQKPAQLGRMRIAVTFGTIIPWLKSLDTFREVERLAHEVDADFVVAHGTAETDAWKELPSNVFAARWIPLDELLPTCDAVIHHAGSGTTLAALGAGIPQLVAPQGADQFANASLLKARGAGLCVDGRGITAAAVRRLLDDESVREAAHEVQAEMAMMPPPSELLPRLIAVAR